MKSMTLQSQIATTLTYSFHRKNKDIEPVLHLPSKLPEMNHPLSPHTIPPPLPKKNPPLLLKKRKKRMQAHFL